MLKLGQNHQEQNTFTQFKQYDSLIAELFSVGSSLKNEVALLIELYDAEQAGQSLTISMLGLISNIPQSTMLRNLGVLERKNLVQRVPHPSDQRMSFVRLAPRVRIALDRVFMNEPSPS